MFLQTESCIFWLNVCMTVYYMKFVKIRMKIICPKFFIVIIIIVLVVNVIVIIIVVMVVLVISGVVFCANIAPKFAQKLRVRLIFAQFLHNFCMIYA